MPVGGYLVRAAVTVGSPFLFPWAIFASQLLSSASSPTTRVIPAEAGTQHPGTPMPKRGTVYILASRRNGTLYVGVTSDLPKRVWMHKHDVTEGFTKQYGVHRLVYFEEYDDIRDAITREKRLKKWNRAWKLRLIEEANPMWADLYDLVAGFSGSPPPRG